MRLKTKTHNYAVSKRAKRLLLSALEERNATQH